MTGERIAVIGNAGAGKSTLSRRLAAARGLPLTEVDTLLWQPGWVAAPEEEFDRAHDAILAGERWLMEGLGYVGSVRRRLLRATWVIAVDMPLWMHFWLAAERQIAWARGELEHPPAGIHDYITTEDMFRTLWETEQQDMPSIRAAIDEAEAAGVKVTRLASVEELNAFGEACGAP